MTRTVRILAAWLLFALAPAPPPVDDTRLVAQAAQGAGAAAPKLVVIVVVDQLRPDYLERYAGALTDGFRRLLRDGAVFERAAYPYLNTVTCAGHSTIGTGAFPYRHGMVLNAWYDRGAGAATTCADDAASRPVAYTGSATLAYSGRRLLEPTLADHVRERAGGRVVSLSLKQRSAIGLAGHGGDVVVWYDDRGGWFTSDYFSKTPAPFLARWLERHPLAADVGKIWERVLDAAAYTHEDARPEEQPPAGWTAAFPHALAGPGGKADDGFYLRWARSPYADEYLARMAIEAIDAMKLGRGQGTDFLGVSFSTLDLVGHAFGPDSHEVQDVVVRLDRTIGRLLAHLDTAVGKGNYVLGFSSDHGVAGIPEQTAGGGRQTAANVRTAIDSVLVPIFGPAPAPAARPGSTATGPARGSYMAYSAYTDTYLARGMMDRLRKDPRAMDALLDALKALPGIEFAFSGDELRSPDARRHPDPVKRAAALSYHPERSGDIIVVPRVNWILSTAATTHGTLHPYDQQVPVILYGAGVKAGRYGAPATPADLPATLAALARLSFAAPDGRVLADAVAAAAPSK